MFLRVYLIGLISSFNFNFTYIFIYIFRIFSLEKDNDAVDIKFVKHSWRLNLVALPEFSPKIKKRKNENRNPIFSLY